MKILVMNMADQGLYILIFWWQDEWEFSVVGDVCIFQAAADAKDSIVVDERIQLPHLLRLDDKFMATLRLTNFSHFQLSEDVLVVLPLHCLDEPLLCILQVMLLHFGFRKEILCSSRLGFGDLTPSSRCNQHHRDDPQLMHPLAPRCGCKEYRVVLVFLLDVCRI